MKKAKATITGRDLTAGRELKRVLTEQRSLYQQTVKTPKSLSRIEIHRARARRNQIQALLANGRVEDVQRVLLEEEEAELEIKILGAYSTNPEMQ